MDVIIRSDSVTVYDVIKKLHTRLVELAFGSNECDVCSIGVVCLLFLVPSKYQDIINQAHESLQAFQNFIHSVLEQLRGT